MKRIVAVLFTMLLVGLFIWLVAAVVFGYDVTAKEPAIIVVLEGESTARQPTQGVQTLEQDSQIDGCDKPGPVAEYAPATRSFHVLNPCNQLFSDDFE